MAECFGYSPRETDRLNIRDLAVMIHAGLRKQRAGFQQAALVGTQVYNMGGPRSEKFEAKQPHELYPDIFKDGGTQSWEEEVAEAFENYNPD